MRSVHSTSPSPATYLVYFLEGTERNEADWAHKAKSCAPTLSIAHLRLFPLTLPPLVCKQESAVWLFAGENRTPPQPS